MVDCSIKINDEYLDLAKYHAHFFGYDVELASSGTIKNRINGKSYFVRNEFNAHKLTLTFLVESFESMLEFINQLQNFTIEFTDSELIHRVILSEQPNYECINLNTYLLTLKYDDDITKPKQIYKITESMDLILSGGRPSPLVVKINAINTLSNYLLTFKYLDVLSNKYKTNIITIKSLIAGSSIIIDSGKFTAKKGNENCFDEIEIIEFPIVTGNVIIEIPNSDAEIIIEVEERV